MFDVNTDCYELGCAYCDIDAQIEEALESYDDED